VAKERAITQLELVPVTVHDTPGWLRVSWKRADGSGDSVAVACTISLQSGRWIIDALLAEEPTSQKLREVPMARIEDAINAAGPAIHEWLEQAVDRRYLELAREVAATHAKRRRLKRPAKRRLDDVFFLDVSFAYRDAVYAGLPPAKTLAAESGTPQGTVNRWIATAREKGFLPKAEPGRVST
jgi:hypothetical protein